MLNDKIYIFWDNSNIFISAKQVAEERDNLLGAHDLRLQFEHLHRLASMGRPVANTFVVGSIPPDLKVWARLRKATGATIELLERGESSGTEQGVDASLQVPMLRALIDEEAPCVAVLLTGDGRGYQDGVGFHADLERMHRRGWGIEVLSWDHSCNSGLKSWAKAVGAYVPLNAHYRQITFIEGGRTSSSCKFTNRMCVRPGGERVFG